MKRLEKLFGKSEAKEKDEEDKKDSPLEKNLKLLREHIGNDTNLRVAAIYF